MLIHPTVERLRALGLTAMADGFIELQNAPDAGELSREDWLGQPPRGRGGLGLSAIDENLPNSRRRRRRDMEPVKPREGGRTHPRLATSPPPPGPSSHTRGSGAAL
jgi:hypothetical protein